MSGHVGTNLQARQAHHGGYKSPVRADTDKLESLVDSVGAYETICLLQAIMAAKAQHVIEARQEPELAAAWDSLGSALESASQLADQYGI
jgi:hypothetical protein